MIIHDWQVGRYAEICKYYPDINMEHIFMF